MIFTLASIEMWGGLWYNTVYKLKQHRCNLILRKRAREMLETLRKVNNILRIIFIGATAVFALAKIFDVVPKQSADTADGAEPVTSEFDEIW